MSPASFSLGRSSSMTAALYCVAAFAVPPEVSVSGQFADDRDDFADSGFALFFNGKEEVGGFGGPV